MRIVVRLLGFALAAVAVMIAGIDMARGFGESRWVSTPLGKIWYDLSPGSLNLAQAVVQRYLLPEIWQPGIVTILTWPAWAVIGGLGVLLLILSLLGRNGRGRRRGYAR